ncbi:MAG: hypothetical protein KDA31_06165 [Phycisphaerales bacterium]|nr:hypothetical protein [Phycisphaerales bacterium]MCB9837563.1 hypothetical protein [Phycisphaera sp.]
MVSKQMIQRCLSIVGAALAVPACGQLAQSDFDSGAEGWTSGGNGGASVQHLSGYIEQEDADAAEMSFIAPASYLGDMSAGYRGRLSFELMSSEQPFAPSRPEVRITGNTSGGAMTLSIQLQTMYRANAFSSYSVKLVESQPWVVVGESRAPTAGEFRELMGSVTELRIVADAGTVPDDMIALDSVRLDPAKVRVYILAGQSNMCGCDDVRNVAASWQDVVDDVMVYWGNDAMPGFMPLAPGTSGASCSNSAPQFYFGPELAFGRELAALYPDDQCLLIKFAVGGTDLFALWTTPTGPNGEFPDGGPLWIQLKQHIDDARADLAAMGYEHQIDGFLWMQGESDADKQYRANAYNSKLTNFIASMREHTGRADMPFVLGRIRNAGQPHAQKVRDAQVAVADADPNTCWFDTDDLPWLQDGIHYDEPSMLILGQRFADKLHGFLPPLGDVNRDGRADVDDLYEWTQGPVDLNCDGVANQADMDIVISSVRADE